MNQILGGVCILLGSVLLGYRFLWHMDKQIEALHGLLSILSYLDGRISLYNDTLECCLQQLAMNLSPIWRGAIKRALENKSDSSLAERLCDELKITCEECGLSSQDYKLFEAPFLWGKRGMGKNIFLREIRIAEEALSKEVEERKKKRKEQTYFSISLGTLGGIFAIIILL